MSARILVIANDTVGARAVQELLVEGGAEAEVLVVAPALSSRVDYWAGDNRRALREAEERLVESLEGLRLEGLNAEGVIGDADPLMAIEDALRMFPATTIVVVTHPPGRSNWLEKRAVSRAKRRFRQDIVHLVADGRLPCAA